jgi:N-acetylmuramoyl-L-alanine amidase
MANNPDIPNIPGGGLRQQRAEQLKAEVAAAKEKAASLSPASAAPTPGTGPVGSGKHVVQKGECISSIARDTGHFWKTIWEDGANSGLREARKDPNILLTGDRVHVPEKRPKQEPGETEMRHRFVRKGEPAHLRMRVLVEDEPVRNAPYRLKIDGKEQEGTTDPDGWVQAEIPGNARSGELVVEKPGQAIVLPLGLGHVPPITEPSGAQVRLNNLGYAVGRLDGVLDAKTQCLLKQFQVANGHPNPSGLLDEITRGLLKQKHGS